MEKHNTNYYNYIYHIIGFFLLIANKIKRIIQGYTNPRLFPTTDFKKAVDYDFSVIENWTHYLDIYSPGFDLNRKTVLELGPGPDLGVGLIFLMLGVKKYNAIDKNNLVNFTPHMVYVELFNQMKSLEVKETDIQKLQSQLDSTLLGNPDKLNYVCNKDFNILTFENKNVNLIVSQAVFEHIDDVKKTIQQLSKITRSGAIFIAEVDLKTHTRWIRDKDPLNIYRFSDSVYNLLKFSGSPNRLRPFEYKSILASEGWINIKITPKNILEGYRVAEVRDCLNERFRGEVNQMGCLSFIICATKK